MELQELYNSQQLLTGELSDKLEKTEVSHLTSIEMDAPFFFEPLNHAPHFSDSMLCNNRASYCTSEKARGD